MDTEGIGRRIAYWRDRRGFNQGDFGIAMGGMSVRWVQDLEAGKRQQDPRVSVLVRATEVLRIPMEYLLSDGPPATPAGSAPPAEVLAVVDALYNPGGDNDPPTLETLNRRLAYSCQCFQACAYKALARDLPALLIDAQKAAAHAPADRVCEAHGILSRALQVTTSFLHKYGPGAAVQAAVVADRALAAAERSGDPVQIGAASRRVAKSLMYQQRSDAALEYAVGTARRLAGDLTALGPLGLSTLGMLYLNAAMAASSGRERSTSAVGSATDLVDEAADVAERQGADLDEDYTMFGPTNVELHRTDMLLRFDDGYSALEALAGLTPEAVDGLSKERRAGRHIAKARASLLTRRKDQAVDEILKADQVAPEEIESRPDAVNLVRDVLAVSVSPSLALQQLAEKCGLQA